MLAQEEREKGLGDEGLRERSGQEADWADDLVAEAGRLLRIENCGTWTEN